MMRSACVLMALGLVACAEERRAVVLHEDPPARLSEWGMVLADGDQLTLTQAVLPYAVNTPLFSDYAQKLRTVWMPPGTAARYSTQDDWEFPVGTVFTKTFYYPLAADGRVLSVADGRVPESGGLNLGGVRLIETRLLVKQNNGWEAYPYVWNEQQTDASFRRVGDMVPLRLVEAGGAERPFTYVVPDANQCAGCHRPDHGSREIRPIGPKTRHLNSGAGSPNQLEAWIRAGYLQGAPSPDTAPRLAEWDRPDRYDLEARARAYLDINCGHCHNPDGAADTSGLFLDIHTTEARRLGRCKPPIAAGRGSGDRRFSIVPGEPDESILVYRMQTSDPGEAMPELGRAVVHTEGVALIQEWIEQMAGDCQPGNAT